MENIENDVLIGIKERAEQLGIMNSDEITEFLQLIQKYWIGLETENYIAS